MSEPRTEAGRRLLATVPYAWRNRRSEVEDAILAIEAEAAASALDDIVAMNADELRRRWPLSVARLLDAARPATPQAPGLNVERLRRAIYAVSIRHDWANTTDTEDRTEEIAQEYAATQPGEEEPR